MVGDDPVFCALAKRLTPEERIARLENLKKQVERAVLSALSEIG